MTEQPRGQYRIHRAGGDIAIVLYLPSRSEKDIPERLYRQNGYEPAFDELPWRGEDRTHKQSDAQRLKGEKRRVM